MARKKSIRVCLDAKQHAFVSALAGRNQASIGSAVRIAVDHLMRETEEASDD